MTLIQRYEILKNFKPYTDYMRLVGEMLGVKQKELSINDFEYITKYIESKLDMSSHIVGSSYYSPKAFTKSYTSDNRYVKSQFPKYGYYLIAFDEGKIYLSLRFEYHTNIRSLANPALRYQNTTATSSKKHKIHLRETFDNRSKAIKSIDKFFNKINKIEDKTI